MKITEEEYNQIIKELAKRLRDSIYINAERKIREKTPKSFFENIVFDEDRARKQVVMSKLYLILRENKDPMVAVAIMVDSIPQWYEFLTATSSLSNQKLKT